MKKLEKMSTDIVFVILHYMVKECTIKCVSEIREKIDTKNYKIIIVDNASNNESGKDLQKLYENDQDVYVILNKENLGFARGNNVGFRFAKENLNPQYIVLLNNDVYILEEQLKCKLDKEYKESQFAVLGPLIMTKDGKCDVNPVKNGIKSKEDVINRINGTKRVLFFNKYFLFPAYASASKLMHDIINIFRKSEKKPYKDYLKCQYNVQLHGCFMVFSQVYIDRFDGLDDGTFLYMEEDILYKHIIENNLVTVYSPNIIVYHEEDVSTNSIVVNQRKKIDFVYSNTLKSCQHLLKVYEFYENSK